MDDAPLHTSTFPAFGLGAHAVDDRLRLFSWATGEHRFLYLWVLRVFDRARQTYEVRLTAAQVNRALAELAATHPSVPAPTDLAASLDALVDWGVLDRSQESGRVTSIADYRRRNSVYQLTELGFLAHGAVERVVSARPDDAQLRAVALGAILEDLDALAAANRAGDAPRVHLLLDRLHGVLTDLDALAGYHLELAPTPFATPVERAGRPGPGLPGWLAEAATTGTPLRVTLHQLSRWTPVLTAPAAVHVCENPAVLRAAAIQHGAKAAPLVYTEGRPSVAAARLLDTVAASGSPLRVRADFDWAGLRIAGALLNRPGSFPWRFGAVDYQTARFRRPRWTTTRFLPGPPAPSPWDPALAIALAATGDPIHEEDLLEDLLADLV